MYFLPMDDHVSPLVSPLGKLTEDGLHRFVQSITFNQKGITGFSYAEFDGMSAADAHGILELFVVERTLKLVKNVRVTTKADRMVTAKSCGIFSPTSGCGSDDLNPGDRDGFYCAGPGSCAPRSLWICTVNC
jgi:hypothetical protein